METVKKRALELALNNAATTLNGVFGISEERAHEIIDWLRENVAKTNNAKDDIIAVIDQFEKPEELVFGLYLLRPIEEEDVMQNDMSKDIPGLDDAV